jgi:O-acetylserine/cysteine efflux transporter
MLNGRLPLLALASAGLLWGSTMPLTKLALAAIDPGWLTAVRFVLAALPLLWLARGRGLRSAATMPVMLWGAAGYGVVIALQNLALTRTSVTHAALLIGTVPALVAVFALALGRGTARPAAWAGFALALGGLALVASDGRGSSISGDLLIAISLLLSAAFTVAQPGLLADRDPIAVTAVQFAASALVALPLAVVASGAPQLHDNRAGWLAVVALVLTGTLVPFTLFAWGQARTTPEVAGAFLNLEPVVGAGAGALAFGDPFGHLQMAGGAAVIAGIMLSSVPMPRAAQRLAGRGRATIRAAGMRTPREATALRSSTRTAGSTGYQRLGHPSRPEVLGPGVDHTSGPAAATPMTRRSPMPRAGSPTRPRSGRRRPPRPAGRGGPVTNGRCRRPAG